MRVNLREEQDLNRSRAHLSASWRLPPTGSTNWQLGAEDGEIARVTDAVDDDGLGVEGDALEGERLHAGVGLSMEEGHGVELPAGKLKAHSLGKRRVDGLGAAAEHLGGAHAHVRRG